MALMKGVASCLAYLENKGIIHGSISPATIYFDINSKLFKIYDANFFIANK